MCRSARVAKLKWRSSHVTEFSCDGVNAECFSYITSGASEATWINRRDMPIFQLYIPTAIVNILAHCCRSASDLGRWETDKRRSSRDNHQQHHRYNMRWRMGRQRRCCHLSYGRIRVSIHTYVLGYITLIRGWYTTGHINNVIRNTAHRHSTQDNNTREAEF